LAILGTRHAASQPPVPLSWLPWRPFDLVLAHPLGKRLMRLIVLGNRATTGHTIWFKKHA